MISAISSTSDWSALQKMRDAMFAKMDTNGDGKIDKSELATALGGGSGQSGTTTSNVDDLVAKIFDALDTNKDGYVDASELAAASQQTSRAHRHHHGGIRQMMQDNFSALDTNGDGKLDKSELTAALGGIAGQSGNTSKVNDLVAKIFDRLDTDKDGYIAESELASKSKSTMAAQNTLSYSSAFDSLKILLNNGQGQSNPIDSISMLGQDAGQALAAAYL